MSRKRLMPTAAPREAPLIDHVLVRRVLRLHNPWHGLGLEMGGFKTRLREYPPQPKYLKGTRTKTYHLSRVRFFMETLASGGKVDPIELDNRWSHMTPVALILEDGNHRLIAAAMTKTKTIPACYSGEMRILAWLKGKRKTCPLLF